MGTGTANWRGIVHRSGGAVVGVGAQFHFGLYGIDTPAAPELSAADAATVKAAAAQSDTATINAVQATGWATWWNTTATGLTNAGAPAGTLVTACRDWFLNVDW